jgi:hypothetical protein
VIIVIVIDDDHIALIYLSRLARRHVDGHGPLPRRTDCRRVRGGVGPAVAPSCFGDQLRRHAPAKQKGCVTAVVGESDRAERLPARPRPHAHQRSGWRRGRAEG